MLFRGDECLKHQSKRAKLLVMVLLWLCYNSLRLHHISTAWNTVLLNTILEYVIQVARCMKGLFSRQPVGCTWPAQSLSCRSPGSCIAVVHPIIRHNSGLSLLQFPLLAPTPQGSTRWGQMCSAGAAHSCCMQPSGPMVHPGAAPVSADSPSLLRRWTAMMYDILQMSTFFYF